MITQQILDFLHGLAVTLSAWLRDALPAPPAWVADLNDGITTVFGMVPEPLRWFFPLGASVAVGLGLVSIVVAAGGIRFARRVLSLFTGGGGNA